MKRRRIKHTASLEERLGQEALRLREQAKSLPAGIESDRLTSRARQTEVASYMNEWLASPGLRAAEVG